MMHRDNVTWWSDSPGSFGELSQGMIIVHPSYELHQFYDVHLKENTNYRS